MLQRTQRVVSQRPDSSRFQQLAFSQGGIEQIFTDFLQADGDSVRVERNMQPESLQLEETDSGSTEDYPITLNVRHQTTTQQTGSRTRDCKEVAKNEAHCVTQASTSVTNSGEHSSNVDVETIKAKYLIGCDGAHSWTRAQLGLSLEGESTDHVWGVMDIVPLTNFRRYCTAFLITLINQEQRISGSRALSTLPRLEP